MTSQYYYLGLVVFCILIKKVKKKLEKKKGKEEKKEKKLGEMILVLFYSDINTVYHGINKLYTLFI